MLFIIQNLESSHATPQQIERCIENLLRAYGEGRHCLWMPIEVINQCTQLPLSSYAHRALVELRSDVVETKQLKDKLEFHIEIDFEGRSKTAEFIPNDRKFVAGFKLALDSEFFSRTHVLLENSSDTDLLLISAKAQLHQMGISRHLQVKINPCNGGGSTTFDEYERTKKRGLLFLCLVDSDRCHPKSGLGSTATRFNKVETGYSPAGYFEILDCAELENLVPKRTLAEIAREKGVNRP